MDYVPANLLGGSYSDESRPWSSQDTVNWIPELAQAAGTRTPAKFRSAPGLSPFVLIESIDTDLPGPIRGMRNVEGKLFVVAGNSLYRISNTGTPEVIGVIPGALRVSMSHNQRSGGNELIVVNGSAGYVYNTVTSVFQRITDPGYPGAVVADYVDSYLVQVEPQGRFWFHSNLADALDYNTLDRYESEGSPDRIVTLAVNQLEVVVFNETTIEFFANTGAAQGTFQSKRIVIDKGCAGRDTVTKLDNTLFWLGDDGVVYRLAGYQAQPISTPPIEQAIAGNNWAQAFGMAYESEGHKIYYLTFPDGRTWGYDVVTQMWHRRQSYGLKRWRPNVLTYWRRNWVAGDFQAAKLYNVDWDYMLEGDDPIVAERVSGVLHNNQNKVGIPYVELIFDTGQPEVKPGLFFSGSPPCGVAEDAYTFTYSYSGGSEPVFSVAGGALPPGITLNTSTGTISGTPTTEGDYSFSLRVEDENGQSATVSSGIHIAPALGLGAPTASIAIADAYFGVHSIAAYVMNGADSLFFTRLDVLGANPSDTFDVGSYSVALAESDVEPVVYGGAIPGVDDRLFLLMGNPDGYSISGCPSNNGTCVLLKDGAYIADLRPDVGSPLDWWSAESSYSPEFGGMGWFHDGYFYLGVRTTGGSGGTYWNRILRWKLEEGMSGIVAAENQATGIMPNPVSDPVFYIHVDNEGTVRTLDGTGLLKRFGSNLAFQDSETIPVSLPAGFRGFGFDQRAIVLIGENGSGFGTADFYSYPDWTLVDSHTMPVTGSSVLTRCVFDDESLYVQRGVDLSRFPYTPGVC